VEVTEIDFAVDFFSPSVAGGYLIGVGLYKSQYTAASPPFQNALTPADAGRDNWYELWAKGMYWPLVNAWSIPYSLRHAFRKKGQVTIKDGEALQISITVTGPALSAIGFTPWLRWKQRLIY